MTFKKGYDPNRNMKGRPKLGLTTAERIRDALNEPARGQEGYTKFDLMVETQSHALIMALISSGTRL